MLQQRKASTDLPLDTSRRLRRQSAVASNVSGRTADDRLVLLSARVVRAFTFTGGNVPVELGNFQKNRGA
jgi:hypothetical protein